MAKVSEDVKRQLSSAGAALGGTWGGPRKQRYYTPSGDEVWAIPAPREWALKDDAGKVVDQGTRDANFDKGWLAAMPTELKLHCPGCAHWHDAEEEVAECVERKRASSERWERKARQMMEKNGNGSGDGTEVAELTDRVETLTTTVEGLASMMKQLLQREVKSDG